MNANSTDPSWSQTFYDEYGYETLERIHYFAAQAGAQFGDQESVTNGPTASADYPQTLPTGYDVPRSVGEQEHETSLDSEAEHTRSNPVTEEENQVPATPPSGHKRKRALSITSEHTPCQIDGRGTVHASQTGSDDTTTAVAPSLTWRLNPVEHDDLPPTHDYEQSIAGAAPPSHATSHSNDPHTCKCGRRFAVYSELWKHQRKYVPVALRPYPCGKTGCQQRFWHPREVTRHDGKMHEGDDFTCPHSDCPVRTTSIELTRHHISDAHRDGPSDPTIVNAFMNSLSVHSTTVDSRATSVFSAPPTPLMGTMGAPLTPRTSLSSRQSNASFGNPHTSA